MNSPEKYQVNEEAVLEQNPPSDVEFGNLYNSLNETLTMQELEKIGVVYFIERVPKEELGRFFCSYNKLIREVPSVHTAFKVLAEYSNEGSNIIGYNIYQVDTIMLEKQKTEVDAIYERSKKRYDISNVKISQLKIDYYVNDERYTDLGILTTEEISVFISHNIFNNDQIEIPVYSLNNQDYNEFRVFIKN